MPPHRNGGSKCVAFLNIGPGVVTYIVTPAYVAIQERDNAMSFALRGSEPNRIACVLQHGSSTGTWKCPSLWLPSLTGLGARVRARSQTQRSKPLTPVVSKLSTVRMIDELSLHFRHGHIPCPFWDEGSRLDARATVLGRHDLCSWPSMRVQVCSGVSVRWSGAVTKRVAAEGPAALTRLS